MTDATDEVPYSRTPKESTEFMGKLERGARGVPKTIRLDVEFSIENMEQIEARINEVCDENDRLRTYVSELEDTRFTTILDLKEENEQLKSVIAHLELNESGLQHDLLIAQNR